MKIPNRYDVGVGIIVIACVALVVLRWGWRESDRAGFPLFSLATLEAIWPWIALLLVCLLAIALDGPRRK